MVKHVETCSDFYSWPVAREQTSRGLPSVLPQMPGRGKRCRLCDLALVALLAENVTETCNVPAWKRALSTGCGALGDVLCLSEPQPLTASPFVHLPFPPAVCFSTV